MPRRKVKTITIGELADGANILVKLKSDPIFESYDFSTLTIKIQESITPKIEKSRKLATRLENYLHANPDCCSVFDGHKCVTKQKLATRMLGVSRGTLDRWINNDLIVMPYFLTSKEKIDICDPYDMLRQLKEYAAIHDNN